MQNKGHQEAIEYINSEKNNFDMSIVFRYLDGDNHVMGDYEYILPNKDNITALLNEAGVYDVIEVEDPDEWNNSAEAVDVVPYEAIAE